MSRLNGSASNRVAAQLVATLLALGVLAMVTLVSSATTAGGATPGPNVTYVSPTTTPPLQPTTGSSTITVAPGTTSTIEACGFAPGSTVTYTWDDPTTGTVLVGTDGCAVVSVAASGCNEASINGGAPVAAGATNTLTLVGTGTNGASRTYTETVLIPQTCTVSTTTKTPPIAFTGADIALMVLGGLILLGGGGVLLVATRRRSQRGEGWHGG